MSNKEILEQAPEGWTHHIERGVENRSSKYLKAEPHWRYYVYGKWYLVPEPMIDFSIRSRADIERIVELENNYNEARRICKEVCLTLGHDAEFPAFCDMQSIVETMVRDNETYQSDIERTTKNKEEQ